MAPELEPYRSAITLVGHRVVHWGERFTAPTLITAEVETALQELVPLAPLHNPSGPEGSGLGAALGAGSAPVGLF